MTGSYIIETQDFTTILDFLRFGVSKAAQHALHYGHGTESAWDDLWSLVMRSLSLPYDVDPMVLQARLTNDEKKHLCYQLQRRIEERVPVPYLIQEAYFCGEVFYVDERVLIPRSPIAELILNQFEPWTDATRVHRILDLCTGSGCIAIACCHAFPEALVDAVDLSPQALEVAYHNATTHAVHDRLTLIESDGFKSVPLTQYDIIVSNPPYVGALEMQSLPQEYLHEPRMALEAPNNGLAIVDDILQHAARYLSDDGILVVEVGNSELALIEAYPQLPFTWLDFENGGQGVFVLTRDQLGANV